MPKWRESLWDASLVLLPMLLISVPWKTLLNHDIQATNSHNWSTVKQHAIKYVAAKKNLCWPGKQEVQAWVTHWKPIFSNCQMPFIVIQQYYFNHFFRVLEDSVAWLPRNFLFIYLCHIESVLLFIQCFSFVFYCQDLEMLPPHEGCMHLKLLLNVQSHASQRLQNFTMFSWKAFKMQNLLDISVSDC